LAIAGSYIVAAAIWLAPPSVMGFSDDATGLILARIGWFPCIVGPSAALLALVLYLTSDSRYGWWWLPATIILGFLTPFFVPAIQTA
jgi:hypothetical protein